MRDALHVVNSLPKEQASKLCIASPAHRMEPVPSDADREAIRIIKLYGLDYSMQDHLALMFNEGYQAGRQAVIADVRELVAGGAR